MSILNNSGNKLLTIVIGASLVVATMGLLTATARAADGTLTNFADGEWNLSLTQPAGAVGGIEASDEFDIFTFTTLQDDSLELYNITAPNGLWDVSGTTLSVVGNSVRLTGVVMDLVNFTDTYTWDDGGGDSNWQTPDNWDLGGNPPTPPTGADKAIVNTGTANVTSNQSVHTLEISSAGAVDVQNNTLSISNDLEIKDAGSLTIAALGTVDGVDQLTVDGGTLTVNGSLTARVIDIPATATFNGSVNADVINTTGTTTFGASSTGTIGVVNVTGGTTTMGTPDIGLVRVETGGNLIANPNVTLQNLNIANSAGTVNASNPIKITDRLTLGAPAFTNVTPGDFEVSGANVTTERTIALKGNTVKLSNISMAGMLGRWNFDDDTADDMSGNENHGAWHGTETYSSDVPDALAGGKSIDLTSGGKAVYVSTGGTEDVFDTPQQTISFWTKGVPMGDWGNWVTKTNEVNGFMIRQHGAGKTTLWYDIRGGIGDNPIPIDHSDGEWHHIVCTYDQDHAKVYQDGVLANDKNFGNGGVPPSLRVLVFGSRDGSDDAGYQHGGGNNETKTQMDDLYYFDRPITDDEVAQLYGGLLGSPNMPNTHIDVNAASSIFDIDAAGTAVALGDLTFEFGVGGLDIKTTKSTSFNNVTLMQNTVIGTEGGDSEFRARGSVVDNDVGFGFFLTTDLTIAGDFVLDGGRALMDVDGGMGGGAVNVRNFSNDGGTANFGNGASLTVTSGAMSSSGSTTFQSGTVVSGVKTIDVSGGMTQFLPGSTLTDDTESINVSAGRLQTPIGARTGTLTVSGGGVLNAPQGVTVTDTADLGSLDVVAGGEQFMLSGTDLANDSVARALTLKGGDITVGILADMSNTTVAATVSSTLVVTSDPGSTVTLGGIEVSDSTTLSVVADDTTAQADTYAMTNLALGDGSTLKVAAGGTKSIELVVSGTVDNGATGIATLGDNLGGPLQVSLTLEETTSLDWTLGADGRQGHYLDVWGDVSLADGLTINVLDGGGSSGGDAYLIASWFNYADEAAEELSLATFAVNLPVGWSYNRLEIEYAAIPDADVLMLKGLGIIICRPVGQDDYDTLLRQYGMSGAYLSADFNRDEIVDIQDFRILREFYGICVGPAPEGAFGPATTPELSSAVLLLLGLGAVIRCRKK